MCHRHELVELFRKKYGEEIPLVNRQDVKGFVHRDKIFLIQPWDIERIRRYVALMELETERFYTRSAARTSRRRSFVNCSVIWLKPNGITKPAPQRFRPTSSRADEKHGRIAHFAAAFS